MGMEVTKWDWIAIWQLFIFFCGCYFLWKRIVDGYVLVQREVVEYG